MSHVPAALLAQFTGSLSRRALAYCFLEKHLVREAAQREFAAEDWAPLAALAATKSFARVGNFRETVGWDQYCRLLADLGKAAKWDFDIVRVIENDACCVVERAEKLDIAGSAEQCGTVSVFSFDPDGKIERLAVYAQLEKRHMPQMAGAWNLAAVNADTV